MLRVVVRAIAGSDHFDRIEELVDRWPDRVSASTVFGPLAVHLNRPGSRGDVSRAMGKTTTQTGPIRDRLIKRGLCFAPRHGLLAFTVPMFDRFIRRALP